MTKICTKCKESLELSSFSKNQRNKDGLESRCKGCIKATTGDYQRRYTHANRELINARSRAFNQRHHEKVLTWHREYNRINKDKINSDSCIRQKAARLKDPFGTKVEDLIVSTKGRAKKKQLTFSSLLTRGWLRDMLKSQPTCGCCKKLFSYVKTVKGTINPDAPSIDRFDSSKGYTLDNINLICWRCNNLKSDATARELETIAAWMRSKGDQS